MDKAIQKKRWFERWEAWVAASIAITLLLIYITVFGGSKMSVTVKRANIEIATVQMDTFQSYISCQGKVEPIRTIYLDAEEGGRVEELFVEEGVMVKKGQAIMRLSNSDLNLSIMNSEASLSEQTSRMRDTRLAMEQQSISVKSQIIDLKFKIQKQKRLVGNNTHFYEKGLVSKEEFVTSKETLDEMQEKFALLQEQYERDSMSRGIQLKQLDESLAMMHNNLKLVRQKLDNLLLRAPVDGLLTTMDAEIGETKQRGQRLGIINVLTAFKVHAEIDEHYIDKVQAGLKARLERNNCCYRLEISKVYPDVKGGSFGIDMKFVDKRPDNVRTGQSYYLTLELGEPGKAMVIPRGGFYEDTGGQWIFVLDADGKHATRREIRTGRQNPVLFEITSGLKVGEQVIVSGYPNFEKAEEIEIK